MDDLKTFRNAGLLGLVLNMPAIVGYAFLSCDIPNYKVSPALTRILEITLQFFNNYVILSILLIGFLLLLFCLYKTFNKQRSFSYLVYGLILLITTFVFWFILNSISCSFYNEIQESYTWSAVALLTTQAISFYSLALSLVLIVLIPAQYFRKKLCKNYLLTTLLVVVTSGILIVATTWVYEQLPRSANDRVPLSELIPSDVN